MRALLLRLRARTTACGALLGLLLGSAQAQNPTWQAAAGVGVNRAPSGLAQVYATVPDGNGNVYLTGMFSGTVGFGASTLTSSGNQDAFVAKWSAVTNSFIWVLPLGGSSNDRALALARSGSSLYVAGSFNGTMPLPGSASLGSSGQEDGFVVKLTDAGGLASIVWGLAAGGTGLDWFAGVAASGNSLYLTGTFSSTAQLGSLLLNSRFSSNDIMVARLNDAGSTATWAWAQRAGSSGPDLPQAIAVSGSSVYVAGYHSGPAADFGAVTLVNASSTFIDGFVAKLTDAGSWAWAYPVSGSGDDALRGVAAQGSSVYVVGNYNSPTLSVGPTTLTNNGGHDVVVGKLTDAGSTASFAWTYGVGSTRGESASGVAVAGSQVYLTGGFTSASVAFGATTLTNPGTSSDVYLARLSDAGGSASFTGALSAGDAGDDFGIGLSVAGPNVYVGGSASSLARFGPYTLPAAPSGAPMGFVASLNDAVLSASSPQLTAGLAVYPNPARGAATVRLPALPGCPGATLILTDALGRTVRTQAVALAAGGTTVPLPLLGLPAGLYHLQVRAGEHRASRALAVE